MSTARSPASRCWQPRGYCSGPACSTSPTRPATTVRSEAHEDSNLPKSRETVINRQSPSLEISAGGESRQHATKNNVGQQSWPLLSTLVLHGYGRVSTADQNPDAQRDALLRAGVHPDQLYLD